MADVLLRALVLVDFFNYVLESFYNVVNCRKIYIMFLGKFSFVGFDSP